MCSSAPNDRDLKLAEKLKEEWPGILKWAIEGCLEWQKQGLLPPDKVSKATEEYLDAEDAFGTWLEECCERDPNGKLTVAELFKSWNEWAYNLGEPVGSSIAFSKNMTDRGFKACRSGSSRMFEGVRWRGNGQGGC